MKSKQEFLQFYDKLTQNDTELKEKIEKSPKTKTNKKWLYLFFCASRYLHCFFHHCFYQSKFNIYDTSIFAYSNGFYFHIHYCDLLFDSLFSKAKSFKIF